MKRMAAWERVRNAGCARGGKHGWIWFYGAAMLTAWHGAANAQSAKPIPQVMPETEVSEATRRQAEGPMRFILQVEQAKDKDKKPPAPPRETNPVAAAPAAASKPRPAQATTPPTAVAEKPAPVAPTIEAPAAPAQLAVAAPAADPAPAAPEPAALPPPPQPTLVTMVEPDIPTAVRRRLKGAQSATLRFNVTPEGAVADLEVLEVSNPALRQPVVDAIRQWRYNPPGQLVAQKVQLQVIDSPD